MNILIPMAGRGSRFLEEGYETPKPFINVNGRPMIEAVLENIDPTYQNVIILALEEHLKVFKKDLVDLLDIYCKSWKIISVNQITEGAACTALLAKDFINTNDPLIITDCDHIVDEYDDSSHYQKAMEFFQTNDCQAGFTCFLSDNPKWSYVKIKDNGLVTEVVEKQAISSLANTGEYYFTKGKNFVKAAEHMITTNDRVRNEFYIAPSIKNIIIEGGKVMAFMVNNMVGLGTPADLRAYCE